jgi:hypothetical protein
MNSQAHAAGRLSNKNIGKVASLLCLSFAPFLLLVIDCLNWPGLVLPFLNNPVGRIILFTLTVLQAITIVMFTVGHLSQRASHLRPKTMRSWLLASTSIIALSIVAVVGPFVVSYINWAGPLFGPKIDPISNPASIYLIKCWSEYVGEWCPGFWYVRIGGSIFMFAALRVCGIWFTRNNGISHAKQIA